MAKQELPTLSVDLIQQLDQRFQDKMTTDNISDFDRGKLVGIVLLLRELKHRMDFKPKKKETL